MTNSNDRNPAAHPWTKSANELLEKYSVSANDGLSDSDVKERKKRFGPNLLRETKTKSRWQVLVEQFKSLIIGLLAVASILSFIFGDLAESFAIIIVIIINAAIGYFTEIRAIRSMEALRRLSRVDTRVRRNGKTELVAAKELVPGDIIILEGGDIITADARILKASRLQVDESSLTGESVPVAKTEEKLDQDTPLADRANMLYKGTAVTRGSCRGVIVATGLQTELGQISELVAEAEKQATPLEKKLDRLGHNLLWVTLIIASIITILGIIRGKEIFLMIETGIALAVAAIPEGLPIVATIALARGMLRMARRNVLINRLASVETLGATNVICTDKTGTLTENKMTVTELTLESGRVELNSPDASEPKSNKDYQVIIEEALKIGALCNNASLSDTEQSDGIGDPLEIALLIAGKNAGLDKKSLLEKMPLKKEEAFDSSSKMMATFHEDDEGLYVAVKGAPESVIDVCDKIRTPDGTASMTEETRSRWTDLNNEMAGDGLRVLAVASKQAGSTEEAPYENLTLVALLGLEDPPRSDIHESIKLCHEAGIKVVMITGDQPVTARSIAYSVGLTTDENADVIHGRDIEEPDKLSKSGLKRILGALIFARVSPKQKLDLISAHQNNGAVVAMTGDGVNDAPALKKADIGIAMGQRGTQVAREAADMILKDDSFSSIVAAVEQGRVIFENIRKFVFFLLSCNVSEILVIGSASMINAPLPILPLQILFLNLVTDVFPALALGIGEGDKKIMEQPPIGSHEAIIGRKQWLYIGGYGLLITASVLGAFGIAFEYLNMDYSRAVSVSFLTLALSQLWHVFNMRDYNSGVLINEITRNRYIWGALALCVLMLIAAVYLPGLSDVMRLSHPGWDGWVVIILMSLVPLLVGQVIKIFDSSR